MRVPAILRNNIMCYMEILTLLYLPGRYSLWRGFVLVNLIWKLEEGSQNM
jgi:hypothetical protein